ncbi:MAG: PKD domain-containing protein, partial [Thermoplasmata archaeon]
MESDPMSTYHQKRTPGLSCKLTLALVVALTVLLFAGALLPVAAAGDGPSWGDGIGAGPTARAGPDQAAFAGQNMTFNASTSTVDGGTIVNYTWDMGDGTTLYGSVVTHAFTNTGTTVRTMTVGLTVRDDGGSTDTDSCLAYVNPQGSSPPTANAGTPPSGTTLQSLRFDGSGSIGTISTYTWDFGDGTGTSGIFSKVNHSYADDGVYTVTLAVTSSDSLVDVDTIQATVTNQAPVVQAIDDIATDVGVVHNLLANASDADGFIASYMWDFGDGSTSMVQNPTHAWSSDGPHQASLNVTDDDGAYTIVTFWVNVTDVAPVAAFTFDAVRYEGQAVSVDGS